MADAPYDAKDVALGALANLLRLMGAELVIGRHRDDLDQLAQAMRAKIGAVTVTGCPPAVVDAGLALARAHVERALTQIRSQAEIAHAADLASAPDQRRPNAPMPGAPILH